MCDVGRFCVKQVHPFLHRLFTDRQIMQLPMQDYLGAWIAQVMV